MLFKIEYKFFINAKWHIKAAILNNCRSLTSNKLRLAKEFKNTILT